METEEIHKEPLNLRNRIKVLNSELANKRIYFPAIRSYPPYAINPIEGISKFNKDLIDKYKDKERGDWSEQASSLADKLMKDSVSMKWEDIRIDLYQYLNEKAQILIRKITKTLLYQFTDENSINPDKREVTPCLYASKVIPLVNGKIQIQYIQKWANLLNFLADNDIWAHGILACGIRVLPNWNENKQLDPPKEIEIFTYFHSSLNCVRNIMKGSKETSWQEMDQNLEKFIGWDVIVIEGEIGNNNWENCPF